MKNQKFISEEQPSPYISLQKTSKKNLLCPNCSFTNSKQEMAKLLVVP